jgi:hypothetical protein
MAQLVLNRFKIELKLFPTNIYFLTENELSGKVKYSLARYKPTSLLEKDFLNNVEIKNWLSGLKKQDIESEEYIYVSFFSQSANSRSIEIEFQELSYSLQKKFLKEIFIKKLSENDFIIEPSKEGVDFSVYKKQDTNSNLFNRFDFVINVFNDKYHNTQYETVVSVGSTDSYIGKIPSEKHHLIDRNLEGLKFLNEKFLIKNENGGREVLTNPIKANYEIRKELLKTTSNPKKKFYRDYYSLIKNFVVELAEKLSNEWFTLSTAFSQITATSMVDFNSNKMVFKGGYEDFATVNGMRDHGPYFIPDDIKKTHLLFIYPDRESANKLYNYFARGYRHFPGLESYVGIPAKIFDKKIAYESDLGSLPEKINNELTQENYSNVIAVCIMPFSKLDATSEQSRIYYQIKEQLLIKNIPSQFIHRDKIFEENFHFSLPNIAIAMLAKCGGIPWKLAKPRYNQLSIGFNIKLNTTGNTYLGSAVFFDNEGIIREVNGCKEGDLNTICDSLHQAIEQ